MLLDIRRDVNAITNAILNAGGLRRDQPSLPLNFPGSHTRLDANPWVSVTIRLQFFGEIVKAMQSIVYEALELLPRAPEVWGWFN